MGFRDAYFPMKNIHSVVYLQNNKSVLHPGFPSVSYKKLSFPIV